MLLGLLILVSDRSIFNLIEILQDIPRMTLIALILI